MHTHTHTHTHTDRLQYPRFAPTHSEVNYTQTMSMALNGEMKSHIQINFTKSLLRQQYETKNDFNLLQTNTCTNHPNI